MKAKLFGAVAIIVLPTLALAQVSARAGGTAGGAGGAGTGATGPGTGSSGQSGQVVIRRPRQATA